MYGEYHSEEYFPWDRQQGKSSDIVDMIWSLSHFVDWSNDAFAPILSVFALWPSSVGDVQSLEFSPVCSYKVCKLACILFSRRI